MKRFLTWTLLGCLVIGLAILAGCTMGNEETGADKAFLSLNGLTEGNPIKVNKEAGTVTMLAQVNGKYLYEPTRHAAVFQGGSNGEKAIFRGLAEPENLYNSLMEIGVKPGNNMTMDNKETTHVQGDKFMITVSWQGAGKDYKLDEVINDSNDNPIIIRFGGNIETARDKKTGCLICLDSCPVGITSNAAYTYGAVEKRKEVGFTGNKDLLPPDGSLVTITYKLL